MSENQALLDAIRGIVHSEIAPLTEHVVTLTDRVDTLTDRVDTLTDRVDQMSEQIRGIEIRLISIEDRLSRVEEAVERLELRTNQVARDVLELQERVDRGFDTLKSETTLALKEIGTIKQNQRADRKKIRELENKVADLQRRLAAVESAQGRTQP